MRQISDWTFSAKPAPPLPPGGRRRPRVRLLAPARSDGGAPGPALRAALVSLWRGGEPPLPRPVHGERAPATAVIAVTADLAAGGPAGRGGPSALRCGKVMLVVGPGEDV